MEYLNEYQPLPSFLLNAVGSARSGSTSDGCVGDVTAEDCNQDSACTTDAGCGYDVTPCTTDGVCTTDGTCKSDGGCSSDSPPVTKKRSSVSVSYTSTSATFTVTRNDATQFILFVREGGTSDSGDEIYNSEYVTTSSATWHHTVTGLTPGKTYSYNLWDNVGGWLTAKSFTTSFQAFDWTYAGRNKDGTLKSGNTKESGLYIYITADEWNELAGLIKSATGTNVTTVSPGDTITAAVVNTAASVLGVGTVTKNETTITAKFFNDLRSAYNNLAT